MSVAASSLSGLPPCEVLKDILARNRVVLPDGEEKPLTANVSPRIAEVLYATVKRFGCRTAVEIGMAQGVSTLAILSALAETDGRLVSIDPYVDWPSGRHAALANVARAGHGPRHRHVQEPSFRSLPQLLLEGLRVDFAYIDGAHDYNNAFIDFFYIDKLLVMGGIVGFNDVGWAGVWPVVKRAMAREDYQEIDVGLAPDFSGRTVLHSIARRILNRPRQDRFFRKKLV